MICGTLLDGDTGLFYNLACTKRSDAFFEEESAS